MEINARYLETVIAGKAATLDRTNQQEVEAFNKLITEYEKTISIQTEAPEEKQTKNAASLDKQMEIFKEHSSVFKKDLKTKASGKEINSEEGFSMDIRDMAKTLKEKGKI